MKYALCIIITQLSLYRLAAQSNYPPAFFQMTLHVQDAVGNRDSVVLGFDPGVPSNPYIPQFGEEDIDTPFDSVLEMRATHRYHFIYPDPFLSKKLIINAIPFSGIDCYTARLQVYVRAIHQPITFTWDSSYVYNFATCQRTAILTPDRIGEFAGFDDLYTRRTSCLAGSGSYTLELNKQGKPLLEESFFMRPVHTGNQDTIYGVGIYFAIGEDAPCAYLVDVESPLRAGTPPVLSPNPAAHVLHIRQPNQLIEKIEVFDMNGRQAYQATYEAVEQADISTENWRPAMYQTLIYCTDGTRHSGRWVKL